MLATPLHPLSPSDQSLLSDFFSLRADLHALAARHHLALPDLIAWAAAPHIAAYVHTYLDLADLADRLRESDRRAATLTSTQALAETTADPVERRRIVQTMLRALPPLTPRRPAPRTLPPSFPAESPAADPQDPADPEVPLPEISPHPAQPPQPPPQQRSAPEPVTQSQIESSLASLEHLAAALELRAPTDPRPPMPRAISPSRPAHRKRSVESLLAAAGASS